jgi:hypothetical protein
MMRGDFDEDEDPDFDPDYPADEDMCVDCQSLGRHFDVCGICGSTMCSACFEMGCGACQQPHRGGR